MNKRNLFTFNTRHPEASSPPQHSHCEWGLPTRNIFEIRRKKKKKRRYTHIRFSHYKNTIQFHRITPIIFLSLLNIFI